MSTLTTEERRRRSMLAPKCRCGNQAAMGSEFCGRCRDAEERRQEATDLTDEFREIEREAESLDDPYTEISAREVLRLVGRLAGAMVKVREESE